MNRVKALKVLYWTLIIGAILVFWVSLRTQYYAVEYSFIALGIWAAAFLVNRLLKKQSDH